MEIDEFKPVIRSILLSLGRKATAREFLTEFKNTEGYEFKTVLDRFGLTLSKYIDSIPDVCRKKKYGEETYIERVSAEGSSHMDRLTIVKKKKKVKSRFGMNVHSSLHTRLPYTNPYRSATTSSSKFSKPQFAAKLPSRPPYTSRTSNSLPLAPHQQMKPIVFKAKSSNSNEDTDRKEHAEPSKSVSLPVHQAREHMKPVIFRSNSSDENKKKEDSVNKSLQSNDSLPPPLSRTMKPIVFKGIKEDSKNTMNEETSVPWIALGTKKDNNLPLLPPSAFSNVKSSSMKEKLKDSADSDQRSDFDYFSKATPKKEAAAPPVKPRVPISSLCARVRKISLLEEEKENKPVMVAREVTKTATSIKVTRTFVQKNPPKKVTQNPSKKPINSVSAEDYHTTPFGIPETRMREIHNQLFFQVMLVEVTSPSQFLFQFNQNELNAMHEEMSLHYKNLEESKHLCIRQPLPGMPVAVYKDDMWQRAEVLCVSDSDSFVHFVDVGCRSYVKTNTLRYLEKSFAVSTRKCYKGSLFDVKPSNGERFWSTAAIMKFMAKTKGSKCYGTIKEKINGFYQLSIVDDIVKQSRVSDYLVAEGVAEVVKDLNYSTNAILI